MNKNDNNTQGVGNEDELERLAQQAELIDGQTLPPQNGEESGQLADTFEKEAESWAQIPMGIGSILAIAMPDIGELYNEDRCMAWGRAMVPVARKYGWNVETVFGPEMALLMATVPLALGTLRILAKYRKIDAKMRQEAGSKAGDSGNLPPEVPIPANDFTAQQAA